MRRTVAKTAGRLAAALAVLVACGGLAFAQKPGSPDDKPKAADTGKADKPAAGSLEEMLAQALRNNPDIRVAEAKVREAEAELNRTRLQVTQRVVTFRQDLESLRATVREAQARLDRLTQLEQKGRGVVAREEVRSAELTLMKYKAELAKAEAELPYLLGKHGPAEKLAFSTDGNMLAQVGADGRLRLWDPATGKEIKDWKVDKGKRVL